MVDQGWKAGGRLLRTARIGGEGRGRLEEILPISEGHARQDQGRTDRFDGWHLATTPAATAQADILKQIWQELPKHMDTPVQPLDEEMLTNLAKEPAVIEGWMFFSTQYAIILP